MKKSWKDYLFIASAVYLVLGFFNILFAWLGLLCFFIPPLVALFGHGKAYCNSYCGRGQLFELLGGRIGMSRKVNPPRFLRSKAFRYGFLLFFLMMFASMLSGTYAVFEGKPLVEQITLLWALRLPWEWTDTSIAPAWVAQFAFGFYGVMLTSTILGLGTMLLYKPRSWCVYCPMGTMTQGICQIRHAMEVIDEK